MLQGSESQLIHIFIFSENTFYQNMFFYPGFLAGCLAGSGTGTWSPFGLIPQPAVLFSHILS